MNVGMENAKKSLAARVMTKMSRSQYFAFDTILLRKNKRSFINMTLGMWKSLYLLSFLALV